MSSPWKSFLIKDILSNHYEIIPSTTTHNNPTEFLSRKISDDRYNFNPIYPLSLIFEKTNPNTVNPDDTSDVPREFRQRKKRKIRAAFTTFQICALENWFSRQKYLTTSDRDQIANELQLSGAQVVTWFQNRRAKLKRHYEQMKINFYFKMARSSTTRRTKISRSYFDRQAQLIRLF